MYKKTLQIQTNFLQEEQHPATVVTTSKINYQQKLQAGILFQKSLSMILARNFIQCWKQLKQTDGPEPRYRKNNRANNRVNTNVQYYQQERYNTIQNQISNRVPKARSQSQMQKLLKTSQSEDIYEEYRVRRNRSVRVINQQVQHSRATVLKEIVQKLKNVRKNQQSQSQQQDQTSKEVLKRISHLERLVKGIRNTSKSQINMLRTTIQQHRIYDQQQAQPQQNIEDQELVRQFMDEVYQIRRQVNQIKLNNQAILKAEIERSQYQSQARSQVSSSSQKNKPTSLQQQPLFRKQYRSQGVQTQVMTKNQSQVTQIQPSLSQIQQKHKKLIQQIQINSKTTAKLTHGNGTTGSSTNLGVGLGSAYPLGASNTETNQTDKFQFSTFNKYATNTNPTTAYPPKISPPQHSQFSNINSGIQYKPFPNLSSNYSNLTSSQPITQPPPPTPPIYSPPPMQTKLLQQGSYQLPSNMSFGSQPPSLNIQSYQQHPINIPPPRPPTTVTPSFNIHPSMQIKPQGVTFQFPKYDHMRTNTSVESKNYIISDLGSTNSLVTRIQQPQQIQIQHYRQPSFFIQQEVRKNITLTSYCSTCGRNCGCPRVATQDIRRF